MLIDNSLKHLKILICPFLATAAHFMCYFFKDATFICTHAILYPRSYVAPRPATQPRILAFLGLLQRIFGLK